MSSFLFYVEPHPIRNMFTHFFTILDNFAKALDDNKTEHRFYIYGNRETLLEYSKRHKNWEENFILPTKKEYEFFESCLTEWDNGGIEKWEELMEDTDLSRQYTKLIKQIYHRQKFDYIVCWGTNFAVKQAAKELKIGFINMELGCSRAPFLDSLVADPWGVNGSSALSKSDIADFKNIPATNVQDDFLLSGGINSQAYESKFSYLNATQILNKIGNKKVALISLQLYDDANQVHYSPFESVKAVLEKILPLLCKKDYVCLIKEHPASNLRKGSENANFEAKLYALNFENVVWLTHKDKNIENSTLFQLADVVITVNSSSGFEALFYDKPVIVLGDAVYKAKHVFPTLENYLRGHFNYKTYQTNIGKIRNFFLNYYLFSHEKANDSAFFFPYLKFIGDMSKENLTVEEIINRFIAYRSSEK